MSLRPLRDCAGAKVEASTPWTSLKTPFVTLLGLKTGFGVARTWWGDLGYVSNHAKKATLCNYIHAADKTKFRISYSPGGHVCTVLASDRSRP